jgi:6-pyruvoyltetrahydropterin/6-carboxytetrahydropterin synthase
MLTITRKLEFDAGHRIPDHNSQCRNLHGHRYALHITLTGSVVEQDGRPDKGMIMDFSDIKELANKHLVDQWDHAFLVYENDNAVRQFLDTLPNHKTVVLDRVPTVENLAQIAFDKLKGVFHNETDLRLIKVTLYETPNCWADVTDASKDSL